jgi:hypothetical protein
MLWPFDRTECHNMFGSTNSPISRQTDKSISSHCLCWFIHRKLMVLKWNNCEKSDWIFYCCSGMASTHLWLHRSQVPSCRCLARCIPSLKIYWICPGPCAEDDRLTLTVAVRSTEALKHCSNKLVFFFFQYSHKNKSRGPTGLEISVDMKHH